MRRIGILKAERLVDLLNWTGFPAVTLYVVCMFIFPWIDGRGEWAHVQDVWNRWQGLNVGMLAFISSITAFNISRFNAEKQREREFLASKAFLPAALSELVSYFNESASVFIAGWKLAPGQQPSIVPPILPGEYKVVFENCIRHAEPKVGEYLSKILVKLQVHDARVRDFINRMQCARWARPPPIPSCPPSPTSGRSTRRTLRASARRASAKRSSPTASPTSASGAQSAPGTAPERPSLPSPTAFTRLTPPGA